LDGVLTDLQWILACFIGVLVFASILDWADRRALRVKQGVAFPMRRFIWAKRETTDRKTGLQFEYYILIIRLPLFTWDYRVNFDDYGWMQRALIWQSRPGPASGAPPAGFSMRNLEPL
jgi:hypothetical protein